MRSRRTLREGLGIVAAGAVLLAVSLGVSASETGELPTEWSLEILDRFPHDSSSFTQGLVWEDGELLESRGLYGHSSLLRVESTTGHILVRADLDPGLFAEGLARAGDRLIQLTWQTGIAFVRDPRTFEILDTWSYEGEGWGLADSEEGLVMSDGSSTLEIRDPETFEVQRSFGVRLGNVPVALLNELEVAQGRIWANVLGKDFILGIDPETGVVTHRVDASPLRQDWDPHRRGEVLNGIAWDGESWWVTGKWWPWMYRVRFVRAP